MENTNYNKLRRYGIKTTENCTRAVIRTAMGPWLSSTNDELIGVPTHLTTYQSA